MGLQLAPIEGTPYEAGTATGVIYLDANGLQRTDGPTVDASSNLTTTGRIVTDSGSTPSTGGESLQIEGTTATLAEFYRRGGGTNSTVVFRGGSSSCNVGVNSTGFAIGASSNLSTNWFHIHATTGDVSSGPITATAQAITDTPLIVNGSVGQTAEVATLNGRVGISAPHTQLTLRDSDAGNAGSATAYIEYWYGSTSRIGYAGMISGSTMSLSTGVSGGKFEVRTASNVLALAIDTSQNATFEGNLTISSPTVPASASATGTAGTISWDADYIYICTATDTWKRVAISTW